MFKVRQFEARTLSWWADQRRLIDFAPPYQRRGGLWSTSDKQFLIDSILNEYDIPKLYLADFTYGSSSLNPNNKQFAVIDGKQRFEAILDFFDGRIALSRNFVLSDDPGLKLAGLSYKDLRANHPSVASRFDNFNLTVMSVITDEEGKINELFVRLNRNKSLTGPEIRNAMQGEVPELMRTIQFHQFFTEKVGFSTARGQDFDIAGKYLLVEFRGRIVETKRVNLDRFVEEGLSADAEALDFERAAERVTQVLDVMDSVFIDRDPLLRTQGPMVPYYWFVRAVAEEDRGAIRPFLLTFDELRAANRALVRDPRKSAGADAELTQYEQWNRSINDAASIEGRVEILIDRFGEYRASDLLHLRVGAP